MTYVCITGSEKTPNDLERRIETVLRSNPQILCELRLDYLDLNPAATFAFLAKLPAEWAPRLVLTQRLSSAGPFAAGQCQWSIDTWQSWWKDVMGLRTWFAVDLDWLILDRLAGESIEWRGRFRSRHAFFSLHAEIDEIESMLPELEASAKHHNAGIKLAAPVRGAHDLRRLALLQKKLGDHPIKIVVAMGAAGKAWRWSRLTGGLSYFAYSKESHTAPGQDLYEHVLPYVNHKQIPDLYVLWSEDPQNTLGETHWNRMFRARGENARYINIPDSSAPAKNVEEKEDWAKAALDWMELAGVRGASVTKPFKEFFPLILAPENPKATNTLRQMPTHWDYKNTDGEAVCALLQREGALTEPVLLLGGGGAASGVAEALAAENIPFTQIRRSQTGILPALPTDSAVLISTWPGIYQENLVDTLRAQKQFQPKLVIDAQIQRSPQEAPLALWAKEQGIRYLPGILWWREQARGQEKFWLSKRRSVVVKEKILPEVPGSKSETIRALAIAAFRPGKTVILSPAICQDTEFFLHALEELGLDCERQKDAWIVHGRNGLKSDGRMIFLGEGAAVLRFLGALSVVIDGEKLLLDAAPSLRARPIGDLFTALELEEQKNWPLEIPCRQPFPRAISVEKSSQYASGFLLAAAAKLWRREVTQVEFVLLGELRSAPYLTLTMRMLQDLGIGIMQKQGALLLHLNEAPVASATITIHKDASALSYFEVLARYESLQSFYDDAGLNAQADSQFPQHLTKLLEEENAILSLKDSPDLAPSLFAAALLFRRSFRVIDAPHLHDKESDRALLLVEAAKKLGLAAENLSDGFSVDARHFLAPKEKVVLATKKDHRLAMAFGLLAYVYPEIGVDDTHCVEKSFPNFWSALKKFRELFP